MEGYERQELNEAFERELFDNPYRIRAVFLKGSVFKDNLVYAEARPSRELKKAYKADLNIFKTARAWVKDQPLGLYFQDQIHKLPDYWGQEIREATKEPISLGGLEVTEEDLSHHLENFCPRICSAHPEWIPKLVSALSELVATSYIYMDEEWLEGPGRIEVFGEVEAGQEAEVLEKLKSFRLTLTPNPMHIPSYRSIHQLDPGKRLSLSLGAGTLHYLPHYELIEHRRTIYRHKLTFNPQAVKQLVSKLRSVIQELQAKSPEDFVVICHPEGTQEVKDLSQLDYSTAEEYRHLARGAENLYFKHLQVRFAAPSDLIALGYQEIPGAYAPEGSIGSGKFLPSDANQWIESELKKIQGLETNLKEPVTWESRYHAPVSKRTRGGKYNLRKLAETLNQNLAPKLYCSLTELIKELDAKDYVLETSKLKASAPTPHLAPFSERGIMRVEAPVKEALAILEDLGFSQGACELVNYQEQYRSPRRFGRVLPELDEYRERPGPLPGQDYMIIHGMTGIYTEQEALERLERVVEVGGLLSTAERRRMGISLTSLSPKGDIASGIDLGVACKIGNHPSYGEAIYFGLKPEVLRRRDIWFSDTDFGACGSRYELYNRYAQKLGQRRFFDPPNPEARETHLKEGLKDLNEVWFKYEVPWDDIDCLFVTTRSGLDQRVIKRMEAYKAEGKVPAHLKIFPFSNTPSLTNLAGRITQRARELRQVGAPGPHPLSA